MGILNGKSIHLLEVFNYRFHISFLIYRKARKQQRITSSPEEKKEEQTSSPEDKYMCKDKMKLNSHQFPRRL